MNVKPLYNTVNLPYLLFKSPKRRWNKPRTRWVSNPNEEGQEPERRWSRTRTKMVLDPNEVPFPAGNNNPPVKYYSSHGVTIRFVRFNG